MSISQDNQRKSEKFEDVELGTDNDSATESIIANTDVNVGLTLKQVDVLREKYGWNEIPAPSTPVSIVKMELLYCVRFIIL